MASFIPQSERRVTPRRGDCAREARRGCPLRAAGAAGGQAGGAEGSEAADRRERARAAGWFEELRDRICAAFEPLEDAQASGPFAGLPAGRFARKATRRAGTGTRTAAAG